MVRGSKSSGGQQWSIITLLLILFIFTTAVLSWQLWHVRRQTACPAVGPVEYQVCFSPNGGCTDAIVSVIDGAKKRILVQAYSFTSRPLAQALLNAKKRGVQVEVILDKSQRTQNYSEADFFAHMGIPTYIDSVHAIAHNKIMIIDNDTVITGSFNFTRAAEERNAENLLIIHNANLAVQYTENWQHHREHSELYAGR